MSDEQNVEVNSEESQVVPEAVPEVPAEPEKSAEPAEEVPVEPVV